MSSTEPPAASTHSLICRKMLATCASASGGMVLVSGSRPLMTLDIRMLPTRLALGIGFSCLKPGQLMLLRFAISSFSFTSSQSFADSGAEKLAEHLEPLAVEALQQHLLHRLVVVRAGVHVDALEQHRRMELLEVGGLLHDVLARQHVAALLQDLHHRLARRSEEHTSELQSPIHLYRLSLHDALPISNTSNRSPVKRCSSISSIGW